MPRLLSSTLVLMLSACGTALLTAPTAEAGPLLRRAQERKACQDFASKLQAVSGNPQQAQLVYQQGVLKLVETFGDNPCGDIPVPASAPAAAPATAAPASTAPTKAGQAPASNSQQVQACQEFASKLQGAQGNPSQAQQIYTMGTQKLTSMFGPNPCPNVPKP